MPIDIEKEIDPLIQIDWTRMSDAVGFFQKADSTYPDRYSIVVTTDETTTDGSEDRLQQIKDNAEPIGFNHLLEYYEKLDSDPTSTGTVFAEDWYVSERPNSPIKILVSITAANLNLLQPIPPPSVLPSPWAEIYFNTFDFEKKLKGSLELLRKYNGDIKKFRGKVMGLDLKYETENLSNSITAISGLMQANGYSYDSTRSDLLIFGINADYQFLYGQLNDGSGFNNLYKSFTKFQQTSIATDQRTVNFLLNLDNLYQIFLKNENIPMEKFFDDYVLNPPTYDFSQTPRSSTTGDGKAVAQKGNIADENAKPQKTSLELENFLALSSTPEQRKNAQEVLDSSANFVGDTVVSSLQSINDGITYGTTFLTKNPGKHTSNKLFKDLLNKIPLQSLIEGALECLGFKGFEFLNLAKAYLNQATSFLDNVASLLNKQIPTIHIPDDFPIADYMKDLGKQILNSLLEAVMGMLVQMIVELIQQLLDACNECALQNEAAGRGRLDGMNFGAFNVGDSILKTLVVGTVGEISSTVMRESGANRINNEVLEETKQWAANPPQGSYLDFSGDNWYGEGKSGITPEEMQQKVAAAKTDFNDYVKSSSAVLTPGEIGNMMLGCGAGTEATEALIRLFDNFPNLKWLLAGDKDVTTAQVTNLWQDLGKVIGQNAILEKVKEVTDAMPESIKCLCDDDDIALRKSLLDNKGLSPEQVKEQIEKSLTRREKRLRDLGKMLEKGNILEDAVPPIYCTMVFRDSSGTIVPDEKVMPSPHDPSKYVAKATGLPVTRVVRKGLIEKDHPSLVFMMNKVLNTIYDSIAMAFNQDISGFVPTLTKDTFVTRPVPRTINAIKQDGTTEPSLNPEWVKMVKDPSLNYSFGPLPADASIPGRNLIRDYDEGGIIFDGEGEILYNTVAQDPDLDIPANSSESYRIRLAAGQMQTGQVQPTPQQTLQWEFMQKQPYPEGTTDYTSNGRRRIDDYGTSTIGTRMAEYTRLYGYSPIPVTVREKGQPKFAPGLKESYETMCFRKELFDISDQSDSYHLYTFQVDNNIFDAAGIAGDIKNIIGSQVPTPPALPTPSGVADADYSRGMELISQAFNNLNDSTYDINYVVPYSASLGNGSLSQNWPVDVYGLTIMLSSPAGSINAPPFIIYRDVKQYDLSNNICRGLQQNDCEFNDRAPFIPQEQLFTSMVDNCLKNGAMTYNSYAFSNIDESIPPPHKIGGIGDFNYNFRGDLYAKDFESSSSVYGFGNKFSTYDGLWRDFYCSFNQYIAKSPFLDLSALNSIDLTPMNQMGQDPDCDINPSMLDVETIKQRIKDEYGLIQCIEASFPNVDGLGSNKDNPFEKANLGGAVLLTVRTYVLEVLLRSIYTFYYFRFSSPQSVDSLLISYIASLVKKDVEQKQFINEFRTETLDLYNRNAENLIPARPKTDSFDEALEYFVRYQIYGVSNRISKTLKSRGNTSLDAYLLIDQSDANPAWIPGWPVQKELNDPQRILKNGTPPPVNANLPTPVPPQQVQELVGTGSLTDTAIGRLDLESSMSYIKNLPLGYLFREYFKQNGNPAGIWSREPAVEFPQFAGYASTSETWGPITGQEPISSNKSIATNRELDLFQKAGITLRVPNRTKEIYPFYLAPQPAPEGEPRHPASPYPIGISLEEQEGLAELIKIFGTPFYHEQPPTNQALMGDYSIVDRTLNGPVYPGLVLKEVTKQRSAQKAWTFKPNQVWDIRAWEGSGNGVPDWIMSSSTWSADGLGGYKVPTPSLTISREGNGGSPANSTYVNSFPYRPRSGNPSLRNVSHPPETSEYLRWITIDGKSIGPWRAPRNPAPNTQRWKLIDGAREYDENGMPTGNTEIADYNAYAPNDWHFTQNPSRQELANGITVGLDFEDISYFGISNPVNEHVPKLLKRASNLLQNGMKYLSLLDFDIFSAIEIVKWEKAEIRRVYPSIHQTTIDQYDVWIEKMEDIVGKFRNVAAHRRQLREDLLLRISQLGVSRDPGPGPTPNPGLSFENGNFIKEYYLRVEEQDYQGMPLNDTTFNEDNNDANSAVQNVGGIEELIATEFIGDEAFKAGIQRGKWANSNYVDKGGRSEFLKGVVNTQAFQEYLDTRFDTDGTIPHSIRTSLNQDCVPVPLSKALIQDAIIFEECGEALAAELGITLPPERSDFVLGDFFKKVSVGVRISYVLPVAEYVEPDPLITGLPGQTAEGGGTRQAATTPVDYYEGGDCWKWKRSDAQLRELESRLSFGNSAGSLDNSIQFESGVDPLNPSLYEKAYYVTNNIGEFVNVIPIVCSEAEIDPETNIRDVMQTYTNLAGDPVGFFQKKFDENYLELINKLITTPEYQSLFRYFFPVDRMLSLNNIYGSEYLRSYKGVNEMFDPTKTRLKDLFFSLYNSGNYPSTECGPNNLDLQLAAMNGIPWEGLAATLALMIAKSVVLIFKGFVEAFDINIAVSKMIRDSIHLINQMIAQGQVLANQTQQLGAAAGSAIDDLSNLGKCTTSVPSQPPDEWFDPVDDTFISPEPQIMYISLALLPITLLPLFWPGLPITPFGIAYWGMDWRPEPNWLGSMPPADWLDKLFSKDSMMAGNDIGATSCNIDAGLPPVGSNDT